MFIITICCFRMWNLSCSNTPKMKVCLHLGFVLFFQLHITFAIIYLYKKKISNCTWKVKANRSEDDKQGHELRFSLLLWECVPESGEKPECLEVDKQISLVVEEARCVLESSGVMFYPPRDRRKHNILPHDVPQHAWLSAPCSLSAKLPLLKCFNFYFIATLL